MQAITWNAVGLISTAGASACCQVDKLDVVVRLYHMPFRRRG